MRKFVSHGGSGWLAFTPQALARVPRTVRSWLKLTSSMTKRLEWVAGVPISVTVCQDAPGHLERSEQLFLNTANTSAQVREVVLSAAGVSLIVARTVFVSRRLRASEKLRSLGCLPLGSLLFSQGDADWRRRVFVQLTPSLPIWRCVRANTPGTPKGSWARRTLYLLEGSPICVTEVMLPSLLSRCQTTVFGSHGANSPDTFIAQFAPALVDDPAQW